MHPRTRTVGTILVAAIAASVLTWQQLHNGVRAHSFMARDDMPAISNWWGILTLPLLTWLALGSVTARVARGDVTTRTAALSAAGAATYGAILSTAFVLGYSDIPRLQVNAAPLLALTFPIYRAEYVWGFVLSLTYTFGGVLPLLIAGALALLGVVLHLGPRWLLRHFRERH